MSTLELTIDFGETGNSRDFVLDGWGTPEPGHSWTLGHFSRLRLPIACPGEPHVLVLDVVPFTHPPQLPAQRVTIGIDTTLLASPTIGQDMAFGIPIAGAVVAKPQVILTIAHLDANLGVAIDTYRDGQAMGLLVRRLHLFRPRRRVSRPYDRRARIPGRIEDGSLQQNVERLTGLPVRRLLNGFESLGHSCAFGAAQHRMGATAPGLLRYAGLYPPYLLSGLLDRFHGIGGAGQINVYESREQPGMFDFHETKFHIWYHTFQKVTDITPDEIIAFQTVRLDFLQRRFSNLLGSGEKTYVLFSLLPITLNEALAVLMALDLYAPSTLLLVQYSDGAPAGSVDRIGPGLLLGTLDARDVAVFGTDDTWLSIAANAWQLRAEDERLLDSTERN